MIVGKCLVVGYYDDYWYGFFVGDEVVENCVGFYIFCLFVLVVVDVVK